MIKIVVNVHNVLKILNVVKVVANFILLVKEIVNGKKDAKSVVIVKYGLEIIGTLHVILK